MKTNLLQRLGVAVAGSLVFLAGGCADNAPAPKASVNPPIVTATSSVAQAPTTTESVGVLTSEPKQVVPATGKGSTPEVEQVIRLAQSGVGSTVIAAFVEHATTPFSLTAEDIVYLTDLGVTAETITEMIRHSRPDGSAANAKAAFVAAAAGAPPNPEPVQTVAAQPIEVPQQVASYSPGVVTQPVVVQTIPQVTYQYFYSSLSPYGSWVELPDYGWCWQPTCATVDAGWRPYTHRGHWINSDCGWYWQSDYSWGWAPFHYGRWTRHARMGWIWAPDSTWGPAWVSWRQDEGHAGWAPLPFGAHYQSGIGFSFHGGNVGVSFDFGLTPDYYTFVPNRYFHDRNPGHYFLGSREAARVYSKTTVINNYQYVDNRVINVGIPVERISTATRAEIPKVTVQGYGTPGTSPRREVLDANRSHVLVYRPELAQGSPQRPTIPANRIPDGREHSSDRPAAVASPAQLPTAPPVRTFSDRSTGVAAGASVSAQAPPLAGLEIHKRVETRSVPATPLPPSLSATPRPTALPSRTVTELTPGSSASVIRPRDGTGPIQPRPNTPVYSTPSAAPAPTGARQEIQNQRNENTASYFNSAPTPGTRVYTTPSVSAAPNVGPSYQGNVTVQPRTFQPSSPQQQPAYYAPQQSPQQQPGVTVQTRDSGYFNSPSVVAPRAPAYSAPQPSYSPPQIQRQAPTYSAPQVQRQAPVAAPSVQAPPPQRSAPVQSPPATSSSSSSTTIQPRNSSGRSNER